MNRAIGLFAGFAVMAALLSGCALTRSTLNIGVPTSRNPDAGDCITISQVSDHRHFEEKPKIASIPSLKYPADIRDESIRLRAVGRKRNGYGKALGDYLLPPDTSILVLTQNTVVNALRESGFRVYDTGEYCGQFTSIMISIDQFWLWMTPGFWSGLAEFEVIARISHLSTPNEPGDFTIRGYAREHHIIYVEKLIDQGLLEMGKDLRMKLSSPNKALHTDAPRQ